MTVYVKCVVRFNVNKTLELMIVRVKKSNNSLPGSFRWSVAGELGKEAELPEKLSSNLDSDRQVEVTDLAEPELMDPVPENIGHNALK